ncbi:hypothetical protein AVEN_118601-1 [Araneus ventricosus]|uniref:Histone-lysine N-methyltransferase SETMAR n=1 Tax=Araneus ventricosus TaxID=182803 RepID=A0A4Y2AVV9_ARAVE|nr:hypothetical protein AVEN_118601-1 [Araneus ventricosus]
MLFTLPRLSRKLRPTNELSSPNGKGVYSGTPKLPVNFDSIPISSLSPKLFLFPSSIREIRKKVGLCETINAAVSCQTLRRLQRAILTSGVVLIHDNALQHNAVITQQRLEQFKWDVSVHSEYCPDLATSDFHLFPELKNWLRSQSFQKHEEI